jgi:TPR repeat protein
MYLLGLIGYMKRRQYNIGCLIEQNKITHYGLNKTDAFKWFELAAKQGDKDAEAKIKKLRQQRR